MPLELFDNTEYEMHSPEEWVQLAQQQGGYSAETLMYQSGSGAYVWVPCRVTSWDPVARAFEVQFQAHGPAAGVQTAPNGHTGLANGSGKGGAQQDAPGGRDLAGGLTKKLVKRLNLRFKAENPAVFDARVGSAKAAREVAESELRLLFYLDALEPGVEEPRLHDFVDLRRWSGTHLFIAQPLLLGALLQLEQIAATVAGQPLWCLSEALEEFRLSIDASDFMASEAGPPPYPLERFEALQHSHLRQVTHFIKLKLKQAVQVTQAPALQQLLYGGQAQ
ncbi:uncharacterized protein HaLaN_10265 [Haematococcus lacustris]|uniref:Uncharacterized protein n=1 Tax=Haematococcus lacustris TaxID=44745 RepID=A0A699Z4N7_HAELA|nr:uncharacterized protein HaLaN_10265 [Haematococcus lacustris]